LVTVDVVVPKNLSADALKALQAFADQTPPAGREHIDARLRRFS
jgi:molecular chaperone DnaJ